MMGAKTIGCINHPGVEAIGRCRQCSKPVCKQCGVSGTNGIYCSDVCREKHEQFMQRAKSLDLDKNNRRGIFFQIRNWAGTLITLLAFIFALGFVSSLIYIPYLSEVTVKIRDWLNF